MIFKDSFFCKFSLGICWMAKWIVNVGYRYQAVFVIWYTYKITLLQLCQQWRQKSCHLFQKVALKYLGILRLVCVCVCVNGCFQLVNSYLTRSEKIAEFNPLRFPQSLILSLTVTIRIIFNVLLPVYRLMLTLNLPFCKLFWLCLNHHLQRD